MKIKILNLFVIALFLGLFIGSCSKDKIDGGLANGRQSDLTAHYRSTSDMLINEGCEESLEETNEKSVFKILFARFLASNLSDKGFKNYIIYEMFEKYGEEIDNASNEFFISEHLSDEIEMENGTTSTLGPSFQDFLEKDYSQYTSIYSKICTEYYDVVVDFVWYGEDVLKTFSADESFGGVKFGAFGDVNFIQCDGREGNVVYTEDDNRFIISNGASSVNYLPFSVKNAESHIVYDDPNDLNSIRGNTIDEIFLNFEKYDDELDFDDVDYSQFTNLLSCSGKKILDLIKIYRFINQRKGVKNPEGDCGDCEDNDDDGLIDCYDPDCNCDPIEICDNNIDDNCNGLVDQEDVDCDCQEVCYRDCKADLTYLKGVAFARPSARNLLVRPGETSIYLDYNFLGVSICDPFNNGADCPPASGSYNARHIFEGQVGSFFFNQGPWQWFEEFPSGPRPQIDVEGVDFIQESGLPGQKIYTYWKAWPIYRPKQWRLMGEWNGNEIGSHIKYTVFERDQSELQIGYTQQVQSTVSNQLQTSITAGGGNIPVSANMAFTFTTGVTNTTTLQITERFDKDILIGDFRMFYCEDNRTIPEPLGYGGDDWYGFLPDRDAYTQNEILLDLFIIK